jgi:hypothetical protein
MSATIRDHNLKAAAMWSAGGRAYDEISRGIANGIDHCVTRLRSPPAWMTRAATHCERPSVNGPNRSAPDSVLRFRSIIC